MRKIDLSRNNDIENYKSLGKKTFELCIKYKEKVNCFYFRKEESIELLSLFSSQFRFYERGFIVNNGISQFAPNVDIKPKVAIEPNVEIVVGYGYGKKQVRFFGDIGIDFNVELTYELVDTVELKQIEKITRYTVKPAGVRSAIKNWGLVVYEKDGHGIVVSLFELSQVNQRDVIDKEKLSKLISKLQIGSYKDWYIPSFEEFNLMDSKLFKDGLGHFSTDDYVGFYLVNNNGYFTFGQIRRHMIQGNQMTIRLIRKF